MRKVAMLFSLFSLAILVALGCSNSEDGKKKPPTKKSSASSSKKGGSTGGGGKKTKEVLVNKGWGTLKGRVTFSGDKFTPMLISQLENPPQGCACENKRELVDQQWLVSDTGGVSDVVIFLDAPKGKIFPIHDDYKKIDKNVVLDQPHCVYVPHAVALFPLYYDKDGKAVKSGQQLLVKNSASIQHNTKFLGESIKGNNGNYTLPSGGSQDVFLKPESKAIPIQCDVHPWMKAYAWSFDHPYAAVTDKEGNFEIKNVPAGLAVRVVAWHDGSGSDGYISAAGFAGKDGKEMTFEDGKTTDLTFSISK